MAHKQPTFSIVVPTHNRPRQLTEFLRSVALLDYPRDDFEVIIVNDGGEQPLETLVAPWQAELNIRLQTQTQAGPANARQAGIAAAQGRFLAFTDDDCRPAPDWLPLLASAFTRMPDCAFGGRTVNGLPSNLFSAASQLLITYLYAQFNADPCLARFFTTNNLAMPAEKFRRIGGLDPQWAISGGEDRDLCDRWTRHGGQMVYLPELVVHHAHELTWRSFWRQHFHYGRGSFRFHQTQALREQRPMKVERASFYYRLVAFPFSQGMRHHAPALTLLLIVSQVANAAGFFAEKREQRAMTALNWRNVL